MLKTSDAHWLAGLLEGDGCFGVRSGRVRGVYICVCMNDYDVVCRAANLLKPGSRPVLVKKKMYQSTIHGARAIAWMMTLFTAMGARRRAKIVECIGVWKALPGKSSPKVMAQQRAMVQAKRDMTHCAKGHPFSGDNLYIKPNGQRRCRACNMAWYRANAEKSHLKYLRRKERLAIVG